MTRLKILKIFFLCSLFLICIASCNTKEKINVNMEIMESPYSLNSYKNKELSKKYIIKNETITVIDFDVKKNKKAEKKYNYLRDIGAKNLIKSLTKEMSELKDSILVDELCYFYYSIEYQNNKYEICHKKKSKFIETKLRELDSILLLPSVMLNVKN